MPYFVVKNIRTDVWSQPYITAPAGYCRQGDKVVKDGTDPKISGPEMGKVPYRFQSRRAAAIQANKCENVEIIGEGF